MEAFMNKWGLIIKAAGITAVLLVVRLVFDYLNFEVLSLTNLVTAFISGAIFTIAIVFAGVLTDFKESEKIPGEIATSIRTIYSDLTLIHVPDRELTSRMQEKVGVLLTVINTNFRHNTWNLQEMDRAIESFVEDISRLVDMNVPPQYTVKLKNEIGNIDRLSHRIKTIGTTSFIPAAYAISELATAGVIILLFFVKIEPVYEGMAMFAVLVMLMTALLLLMRDMDNPFEVGKNTFVDVDLFLLWDLEKKMNQQEKSRINLEHDEHESRIPRTITYEK
ncbi:MAG: hypothetical protein M0P17_08435 [Methanoculleus sp.]|jgi:hypothetical protein|nr:hypothetical protein [Methanoculleus sp.]